MDNPKWLRLIIIGLVLTALVVIYLLFTGAFAGEKNKKTANQPGDVNGVVSEPSIPAVSEETNTPSAYDRIAERTKASVETLPNTGSPIELLGLVSIGVATVGWGLRKYPN